MTICMNSIASLAMCVAIQCEPSCSIGSKSVLAQLNATLVVVGGWLSGKNVIITPRFGRSLYKTRIVITPVPLLQKAVWLCETTGS